MVAALEDELICHINVNPVENVTGMDLFFEELRALPIERRPSLLPLIRHMVYAYPHCFSLVILSLLANDTSPSTKTVNSSLKVLQFLVEMTSDEAMFSVDVLRLLVSEFSKYHWPEANTIEVLDQWVLLMHRVVGLSANGTSILYSFFLQELDRLPLLGRISFLLSSSFSVPFLMWLSNHSGRGNGVNECLMIIVTYSYLCDTIKKEEELGLLSGRNRTLLDPFQYLHRSTESLIHILSNLAYSDLVSILSFLNSFFIVIFHGVSVVKEDVITIIKTVLIAVHEMNMTQYIMTLIHMTLDDPQSWRLEALAQIIVSKPMQITLTVPLLNSLMLSESYISLSQKPSYLQNLSVYLFDSSHCLSLFFVSFSAYDYILECLADLVQQSPASYVLDKVILSLFQYSVTVPEDNSFDNKIFYVMETIHYCVEVTNPFMAL